MSISFPALDLLSSVTSLICSGRAALPVVSICSVPDCGSFWNVVSDSRLSAMGDTVDGLTTALKGIRVVPPLASSTLYVPCLSLTEPNGNEPSGPTLPEYVSTNVPSL